MAAVSTCPASSRRSSPPRRACAAAPDTSARRLSIVRAMLEIGDSLAHRALEALVRAESSVRRTLAADLERHGLSAAGFSALVVLTTAGGELELRTLRRRLGWTKARASQVTPTPAARGLLPRPPPRP